MRRALAADGKNPTGSALVLIHDGEPHYEIIADSAYDFIGED
ncbi:MAG: hypothetical protein PHO08_18460 [Methylococcales bacterium]|nr:hypothetical protein [Methylococcales bacterium]MDD5631840.1 hypothetical protein [Methylococcales bacterium]